MSQANVDTIKEKTLDNGVDIETVKIKDGLITNLTNPTEAQGAATKAYADSMSVGSHAKTHWGGSGDAIDLAKLVPSGDLSMESNKITNLTDPDDPQDVATRQYVLDNAGGTGNHAKTHFAGSGDAVDLAKLQPSGDVNMNGYKITGLDIPTASGDACNKSYADSAGGAAWRYWNKPAGSWNYWTTNPAPLERDVGTHRDQFRHLMDDTTEEGLEDVLRLPSDLDASGTVYFGIECRGVTAAAGKQAQVKIRHTAVASGESFDVAHQAVLSGDLNLPNIQDIDGFYEFSETVANLGWVANDSVLIEPSRIEPSGDDLTGDLGFSDFRARLPRA